MTPTEALFHTMSSHWMLNYSNRKWPKPGEVVEHMGPEIREALSRLTSDELREVPLTFLGGVESERERRAQEKARLDPLFHAQMEQRRREIRLRVMFESKLKRDLVS